MIPRRAPLAVLVVLSGCLQPVSDVRGHDAGAGGGAGDGGGRDSGSVIDAGLAADAGGGLCSADGWCWTSPTPQGEDLAAVWASSPGDVWAVGAHGAVLHLGGDGGVDAVGGPCADDLTAVWGTGPQDVWVGTTRGWLYRWSGAWTGLTSPATTAVLRLFGFGPSDVWLVAADGSWHWNGAAWTRASAAPRRAVWGASSADVWAVGSLIEHWDGGAWAQASPVAAQDVFGVSSNDVYFLSANQRVLHWDGARISELPFSAPYAKVLWATRQSDVHLLGSAIQRWNGLGVATWVGDSAVASVFGAAAPDAGATDAWAVGACGELRHWDGVTWAQHSRWLRGRCFAATDGWAAAPNDVWLAGADRTAGVVRRLDADWTAVGGALGSALALWGAAPGDVWVFGAYRTASHWNGAAWSAVLPSTGAADDLLTSATGTSASEVWAVGGNGQTNTPLTLRLDGGAFQEVPSAVSTFDHYRVWAGAGGVWAVGAGQVFQQVDGGWTPALQPGAGSSYLAVWGASPADVWAVGVTRTTVAVALVAHWDGVAWSPATIGAVGAALRDVAGSASDDVWAVGDDGTVLQWDGGTWAAQHLPSSTNLERVLVPARGDVWAIGQGRVFQHRP